MAKDKKPGLQILQAGPALIISTDLEIRRTTALYYLSHQTRVVYSFGKEAPELKFAAFEATSPFGTLNLRGMVPPVTFPGKLTGVSFGNPVLLQSDQASHQLKNLLTHICSPTDSRPLYGFAIT